MMREYSLYGNSRVPCGPGTNRRRKDFPKTYFNIRFDSMSDDSAIRTAGQRMAERSQLLKLEEIISAGLWQKGKLVKYYPKRQ